MRVVLGITLKGGLPNDSRWLVRVPSAEAMIMNRIPKKIRSEHDRTSGTTARYREPATTTTLTARGSAVSVYNAFRRFIPPSILLLIAG